MAECVQITSHSYPDPLYLLSQLTEELKKLHRKLLILHINKSLFGVAIVAIKIRFGHLPKYEGFGHLVSCSFILRPYLVFNSDVFSCCFTPYVQLISDVFVPFWIPLVHKYLLACLYTWKYHRHNTNSTTTLPRWYSITLSRTLL